MTSAHPTDSAVFGHLWTTPEASALFSDEGRIRAWLQILAALAQAQAEVGLVPPAAAAAIQAHADSSRLDLDMIAEQTRATGHSTMGLIRALRQVLPEHAREWVYYGATVQDLSDTWFALVFRALGNIAARDVTRMRDHALSLAAEHRDTPMCGRTHGQPGTWSGCSSAAAAGSWSSSAGPSARWNSGAAAPSTCWKPSPSSSASGRPISRGSRAGTVSPSSSGCWPR
jgi:hypothetical protein